MKVISVPEDSGVHVSEMKDGQIAEIVSWVDNNMYIGVIVQKYGNWLVRLGSPCFDSRGAIFDNRYGTMSSKCRVKILPPGTKLEI